MNDLLTMLGRGLSVLVYLSSRISLSLSVRHPHGEEGVSGDDAPEPSRWPQTTECPSGPGAIDTQYESWLYICTDLLAATSP
jgi:hypothetical protein